MTERQRLVAAIRGNPALVSRLLLVAEPTTHSSPIASTDDAYAAVAPLVAGHPLEHFAAVALDRRHRVIASRVLTVGSDCYTVVCPRQIYRWALQQGPSGACAIIIAHNHPSGDPTPSEQDREVTRRVRRAGEAIGIPLLDHIVVGAGGSYRRA